VRRVRREHDPRRPVRGGPAAPGDRAPTGPGAEPVDAGELSRPAVEDAAGRLIGAEAVVDKDLTAALLGIAVGADRLVVLTDVSAVMTDFGTPRAAPLRHLDADGRTDPRFPAGSMGPKIEACRAFALGTGRPAAIGALTDAEAILAGTAGTTVSSRVLAG
jgi:carbamate kinase